MTENAVKLVRETRDAMTNPVCWHILNDAFEAVKVYYTQEELKLKFPDLQNVERREFNEESE